MTELKQPDQIIYIEDFSNNTSGIGVEEGAGSAGRVIDWSPDSSEKAFQYKTQTARAALLLQSGTSLSTNQCSISLDNQLFWGFFDLQCLGSLWRREEVWCRSSAQKCRQKQKKLPQVLKY